MASDVDTGFEIAFSEALLLDVEKALTLAQQPRSTTIVPEELRDDTALSITLPEMLAEEGAPRVWLEDKIGEGGMGVVHLATQRALYRKVAVKSLPDRVQSPKARLRLLQEAWVIGNLEHPNILPIYDIASNEQGDPLVLLKRIEGKDWSALMHDKTAFQKQVGDVDKLEWNLRTLMQVCNAVHFAHSQSIVHRDIKPQNVMIGRFGEVYLLDWGIAVSLGDDSGRFPVASRNLAGTPCYFAPEMIARDPSLIGPRTDVYLLGATLFEIITGDPPHCGGEDGTWATLLQRVSQPFPKLPKDTPLELAAVCQKAMARNPDDRFSSAEELRDALAGFLGHRGSYALSTNATLKMKALFKVVDSAETGIPDDDTLEDIYRDFGACVFGFRAAIEAWSDNGVARAGLYQTVERMVRFELSRDDAPAASRLLATLNSPNPSLKKEVQRALEKHSKAVTRTATLVGLGQKYNPAIGRAVRGRILTALLAMFVVIPLIKHFTSHQPTYRSELINPAVYFLLLGGGFALLRKSLLRSRVNQHIVSSLLIVFCTETVLTFGQMKTGIPVVTSEILDVPLWAVAAAAISIQVRYRTMISAAAYLTCFFVSLYLPDWRYLASFIANCIVFINVQFVFGFLSKRDSDTAPRLS